MPSRSHSVVICTATRSSGAGSRVEHERAKLADASRVGRSSPVSARAEPEEHLALVRRAPIQTGAAIDRAVRNRRAQSALNGLPHAFDKSDANRRADGAGEAVSARIFGRDQNVRVARSRAAPCRVASIAREVRSSRSTAARNRRERSRRAARREEDAGVARRKTTSTGIAAGAARRAAA